MLNMKNGTKIVTSIYELNYITQRNNEVYKNFELLTITIRNIIFPEYDYVIYTDQKTYNKHNLSSRFNYPNVEIKFKELNTSENSLLINNIRKNELSKGMNYDRIYCVENYLEVILNKLEFLLEESKNCDTVFWVDSGLMGTSCHDGWRDYMVNLIHTEIFIKKIIDKINTYGFIHLKGDSIDVNYDLKRKINDFFGVDLKIVPGCLFGGKSEMVKELFYGYSDKFKNFLKKYNQLISEQEILTVITTINKDKCKSFDFDGWLDLQKGLLKLMDNYNESKYQFDKCYN